MGLVDSFLSMMFGDKSKRDMKELMPFVQRIQEAYPRFITLSNDELRAESDKLKMQVREYIADDLNRVEDMKVKMESTELGFDEKESLAEEIDKLRKSIDDKLEEILNEILPEADRKSVV